MNASLHQRSPDQASFPSEALAVRDRLAVVQDTLSDCPYVADTPSRLPLHYPTGILTASDVDDLLAGGFRRSGTVMYYTRCPTCQACEATRVDVRSFRWTKSMRRVLQRAEKELTMRFQPPIVDDDRVRLYNRHRRGRHLDAGGTDSAVDANAYASFLTHSCWQTLELEIRLDGELVAVSIMDLGEQSVSAVYTHFEPDYARYSLGTLAILQQIKWAQANHRRWVYLGFYVAENRHLNYKSRFKPQQRRIHGRWHVFD
ncbi:MAG: arginyltransferase [Planctomycetota bacterium]